MGQTAEFTSYIGGLLSMWVGFSLLGFYDVVEAVAVYIYKRVKDTNNVKTKLDVNSVSKGVIPPVQVYDSRLNYDEEYRKQQRRKTWQRKARVAAIVDRWTRSGRDKDKDVSNS